MNRIFAIAGPTASGKTALGVKVAQHFGGEVVNFDSVQIYRGIEIATAKPSDEEKQGIPHHLIGYVDPNVNYTASDWAKDATAKILEIEGRGKTVVLVGGTGFYLRSLLEPIFEGDKPDQSFRDRLHRIAGLRGKDHLHRMLRRLDPAAAELIPPGNLVRVVRALEVYFQTGKPFTEVRRERPEPPEFARRVGLFVLGPPREVLYKRINRRTVEHFEGGLVEEVKHLLERGVKDDTNALGAHGYRRVCELLRGDRTLESAIELSQQNVRNYAKRQLTWYRKHEKAIWLDGFGDEDRVWREFLEKTAELG
ncbi:MAG: tRNA (adenosine(37)-N6)-dimethylallyltransferase MiaA [Blastocatellia bacterium]|nr:tRNA (adenosine(37)-N6)-dimethylallyltransferase MiaA [Blastocatellia bacterium]